MSDYDTLKESPWLLDEKTERVVREKAAETELSPGEVMRQSCLKGVNQL